MPILVTHHLEEDIQPGLALHAPKHLPMLKPRMSIYSVDSTEDILNLFHLLLQHLITTKGCLHSPIPNPSRDGNIFDDVRTVAAQSRVVTAVVNRGASFSEGRERRRDIAIRLRAFQDMSAQSKVGYRRRERL